MLFSAGVVGINLTQANRVFLMEPCFNPAHEAQAIGRVHRLGQTRPVENVRLIVVDSIETRLQDALEQKYGDDPATTTLGGSDREGDGLPPLEGAAALVGSIRSDKAAVAEE